MFFTGSRRVLPDEAMNVRSAIALVAAPLALIAVGGCGGGGASSSTASSAAIPHSLGLQLVGRTSAVEASLKTGDQCRALDQARLLQRAESDAIAAGRIPVELRAALVGSTQALLVEIHCTPPPAPPAPPAPHHHHEHHHPHDKGKDHEGGD
jgi:hypothetical protein